MTSFESVLVIHVIAVFVLVALLGIEFVSLVRMSEATTAEEAYPWLTPAKGLSAFAGISVLTILVSGIFLVHAEGLMEFAWPKVAAISLVMMAPFGVISSRRMAGIRKAYDESRPEVLARVRDPFLRFSLAVRMAVFLGIFLLVSAKPGGLKESLGLVVSSAAVGLGLSLMPRRRKAGMISGLGD